jgi:hypothetical protein
MKLFIVIMSLISVCLAQSDEEWKDFQGKYKKTYESPDEENNRRSIYSSNIKLIKQHNEEQAKGLKTYTLAENEFTDKV